MHPLFDAQVALGFVLEQAAHIESTINEIVYPDIQYTDLIPVDTSAHPFTKTVIYYSSDKFGRAQWINGNSDDIPMAGTSRTVHQTAVHTAGIGYGWGWEEINTAQLYGVNLPNDDAAAARRAYEEFVDEALLWGDAQKNYSGLLQYPGIDITPRPAGSVSPWETAPPDQILADINAILTAVRTDTLQTSYANTLLIPHNKLQILATRRLADGLAITILDWIRQYNVTTATTGQALVIRGVLGLEEAGAAGSARVVAYRRDPNVLKAHIPMPHRFLPAYQDGPLHWVVPGVFRFGGLDIRRPKEVRYLDGI